MRWFAGWVPGHRSDALPPAPAGGCPLWSGDRPVWTIGEWADWQVRTLEFDGCRVAALGACLATDAELTAAVADARRAGDYTCLAVLPGNCVIVVADSERMLAIVTDLAGCNPVFLTRWAGGVMFASSPLPLADLTGAGPDLDWLAATLMCPEVPNAAGDRSAFTGICRSRPGHVLLLGDGEPRQRQIPLRLGGGTAPDGAAALRTALVTAVQRRIDTCPAMTTDLSGGLDSSTLALLAAVHRPGRLAAITYVDPVSGSADDLAYAKLCARSEPRLRHLVVTGDTFSLPFTDLDTAPLLDEPSQDALLVARTRVRLAPALAHGSQMHLSGDGGDVVLAGTLTYLADLVRVGRARDLVREASAWARLRHRPARTVIGAAVRLARTGPRETLRQLARQLREGRLHERQGVEDHLTWCALSAAAAWASPPVRHRLADRVEELGETDGFPVGGDASALRAVHWNGASSRAFEQHAGHLGVTVHVPFLDNQVVRACMGVTVADRTTTATAKPLLAAAVGGLVPAALLERRTKGDYTACLYAGLYRAAPHLRSLLCRPLLAEYGLIDPAPLAAALNEATSGRAVPLAALGNVIAAEQWLRQVHCPRPALWTVHSEEVRHATGTP